MSGIRIGSQFKRRLMNEIALDVTDVNKKLKTSEQQLEKTSKDLTDVNRRLTAALRYIADVESEVESSWGEREACDSCGIFFTLEEDYHYMCSANEYDQCEVWCGRDFCKQNVFSCDDCGYGYCADHGEKREKREKGEDCDDMLCRICKEKDQESQEINIVE